MNIQQVDENCYAGANSRVLSFCTNSFVVSLFCYVSVLMLDILSSCCMLENNYNLVVILLIFGSTNVAYGPMEAKIFWM